MEYRKTILKKTLEVDEPYIDIWLRFDSHIGHKEFDKEYYQEYCKWLKGKKNRFDIWGGDNYELAIPTAQKYKYLPSQNLSPENQWEDLSDELKRQPWRHLIYILGNHEMGRIIYTNFFEDPIEKICNSLEIPYSRKNTYFILRLNGIKYIFYLSHGRTSAREPDYPLKELIRKNIAHLADIVIVGHTHHNFSAPYYRNHICHKSDGRIYVMDTPDDEYILTTKKVLGIRAGSFLYNPEYVGSDRPRPVVRGNTIIRIYTNTHCIEVYENLDEWKLKNNVD